MKPQLSERSPEIRDLIFLSLAAGLLFFLSLGQRDLWNPNEPIYGRAVAEMAQNGNWLIPTVNDRVFAEKPIFYFWAALVSSALLGGVDELSLRAPAAVAGVASVLLTFVWALPYVGRRRALTTAALFATLYQVFWASRSVQMDVFVLASTLGVIVPLTRLLDFGMSATRAWSYAGLAAGLGFLAKGPVSLVLPGVVVFAYAMSTRQLSQLMKPRAFWGVGVCLFVSLPWYATLWIQGESEFLYEVLIRQNFMRFIDAWDHKQPWWYFLKYLWIDYAPWSWLLPAAAFTTARTRQEGQLQRQSWIWIVGILFFFSLSESKRAPYILPIAPAVASLAAIVVDRKSRRLQPTGPTGVLTELAIGSLGALFLLAGLTLLSPWAEMTDQYQTLAKILGSFIAIWGLLILGARWLKRDYPALSPALLLFGLTCLYAIASVWVLPAIDPVKSARAFAGEIDRRVTAAGKPIVSYRFWDWRAGYAYYADRVIPNLKEPGQLIAFWRENEDAHVLVEAPNLDEVKALLPLEELVHRAKIGGREAFLFRRPPETAGDDEALSLALLADIDGLSVPSRVRSDALPEELKQAMTAVGVGSATVEHRRVLAYEIKWRTEEGLGVDILADQRGLTLAAVVETPNEEPERLVSAEQLPSAAREAMDQLVPDGPRIELRRELEWGLPVHALAWAGPRGVQELKVLDDGRILFIELPEDEPIPEPVRRLAAGFEVDALMLDAYSMAMETDRRIPQVMLAAGWPVTYSAN